MAMAHPEPPAPAMGGYDHEFVEPTDAFKCAICLLVCRDPKQTEACGHSFCTSCWQQHTMLSDNPYRCPSDTNYAGRVFLDRKMKRMIDDLRVYCDYSVHGCDAITELRHIQAHMTTCQYQLVPCDLLCSERVLLWSLAAHKQDTCARRHVTCPLCADDMLAQDVQNHETVCREVYVNCEWCHGDVPRKLLSEHLSLCLECLAYCSFAKHGCKEKIVRRKLKDHHKTDIYWHMEMLNMAVMDIHEGAGTDRSRRGGEYRLRGGDRWGDDPLYRPYELPQRLWCTVETVDSEATIPWAELPGVVYHPKRGQEQSLSERVATLERANVRLNEKIAEIENADYVHKTIKNVIELTDTIVERMVENQIQAVLQNDIDILWERITEIERHQDEQKQVVKTTIEIASECTVAAKMDAVKTIELKKKLTDEIAETKRMFSDNYAKIVKIEQENSEKRTKEYQEVRQMQIQENKQLKEKHVETSTSQEVMQTTIEVMHDNIDISCPKKIKKAEKRHEEEILNLDTEIQKGQGEKREKITNQHY